MLGNYSRRDQAPFGGRTYTGCSFYRGVGLVSFIGRARYRHDAPPPFSPNSTTNDRISSHGGAHTDNEGDDPLQSAQKRRCLKYEEEDERETQASYFAPPRYVDFFGSPRARLVTRI